ncbi:MAG: lysoplasmalogenase family protein [Bacteroidota bacterium]
MKPIIPLVLIIIYYIDSDKKNGLFITALVLSIITNILFIPDTPDFLFYGLLVFTVHRIVVIYLIFSLQKVNDSIPLIIATAPFLLIFFYLFLETVEIPANSVYLIIFHNLLISMFAGIALSSYFMNDNKQNSVLLISALLFVMLQFVVFVEKYFLMGEYEELLRPLAMTFNALAFFSFYKYIIIAEKKLNHN